ncbi:L,D-transpeptidase [Caulobacter segnis]|uniref:L,D-transpeptidase family protein n=1 Tax=Caulobacter segnis TaxID=88688 RepID=UPI001CBBC5EE|nr:L,D-transpeptidase family protein [Caulobacter segnis]UAL10670.1 L,D-transpeptidase family protein [Caulobacter segnis]
MLFRAHADGRFELDGRIRRCAIGKAGAIAAADKREGDNRSPLGTWVMREVWYRPDVYPEGPRTALPVRATRREDGWCDAPGDPNYNRPVTLPYPASAERMWRDDHVYDLVVILGHNDDPPVPGLGSAIFMHLARDGYPGTEGCVALERLDIEAVLAAARPGDAVEIVAD